VVDIDAKVADVTVAGATLNEPRAQRQIAGE
jgi:hypothetical protein